MRSGPGGSLFRMQPFATLHGSGVETFTLVEEGGSGVDLDLFNEWLPKVLRDHGEKLFRLKGFIFAAGEARRLALQGVHMTFTGERGEPWGPGEPKKSTLVFIGKKPLPRMEITMGFKKCLVESRMHGSLFGGGAHNSNNSNNSKVKPPKSWTEELGGKKKEKEVTCVDREENAHKIQAQAEV